MPLLGKSLKIYMKEAANKAQTFLAELIGDTKIICQRYKEKVRPPFNQEAFVFRLKLPYQKEPLVRVLVEVTVQEKVLTPSQEKQIIHGYGESIFSTINAYALEEIIAEKACAILTTTKKLHEKTWVRSRARDYYDLWCIFKKFSSEITRDQLPSLIQEKCSLRGEKFTTAADFFEEGYTAEVNRTWNDWLGPLVPNLPSCQLVLEELKPIFETIIKPPTPTKP